MNLDRRLLALAVGARAYLAFTVSTGVLLAAATVLQAHYLSRIVNQVFLEGRGFAEVSATLVSMAVVIVARGALVSVRDIAASRAAISIRRRVRERLLSRLLALGPIGVLPERTGELTNTAVEGVEALDGYFSQYLPSLVLAILVPTTILLFVFPVDILSGLVFLVTAPLIPIFVTLIGGLADRTARRQWESLSRMSVHFLDVLQGLPTLKLFGRSREQTGAIERVTGSFRDATLGVLRVAFLSSLVLEMVAAVSTAVVAVEVGLRLLYGSIGFEHALLILILAPEFYQPLRGLGAGFHAGVAGAAAAERIFEVLGEDVGEGGGRRGGRNRQDGQGHQDIDLSSVRLEAVSYSYPGGARPALANVSFEIRRGETVALAGPSGAGKSTVAKLLLRFLEPDGGRILAGQRSVQEIPPEVWRRHVAWVPQFPHLFHSSVIENIRLGRPEASIEEVVRAAKTAGAHDFVEALPYGYGTMIGERGARLSGGEAQRIALARAFLKDASLLILDEATSNLDAEQEALVGRAIDKLAEGRMVLIIAHADGIVRKANRVVVLEDGRVSETRTNPVRRVPLSDLTPPVPSTDPSPPAPLPSVGGEEMYELTSLAPFPKRKVPILIRLLGLAVPYTGWMALAALAGFATIAAAAGLLATAAYLISAAALRPSVADLAIPIVGVRFFGISRGIFRYAERYVSHSVTFRLLSRLRVQCYQAIERLPMTLLLHRRAGDLLAAAVSDVETLQHLYVRAMAPPVVALLVGLAAWSLLLRFDPAPANVLLAFFLASAVGLPIISNLLGREPGVRVAKVRAELSAQLVDSVQGIAELLAFGQEVRRLEQLRLLGGEWERAQTRMAMAGGFIGGIGIVLSNGCMAAMLASAIALVGVGRLDALCLAALALAALACFEAAPPLPLAFQQLGGCLEAGRRLFGTGAGGWGPGTGVGSWGLGVGRRGTRDRQERSGSGASVGRGAALAPTLSQGERGMVLVEGLTFRYGAGEPTVLDGVSFQVKAGQTAAVVGANGAGKSTLAHLLLGLVEPSRGRIVLAGRDIRDYPEEELRRTVAAVPQRIHLFAGTIRENLLLARPEATTDDLVGAAEMARLHSFIRSLPEGYDTWIGEQGMRLSGGERQRLAIARALLVDAPILILDEPTANLDGVNEREVIQAIRRLMANRTTIVITHRPAVLGFADEVLELASGRMGPAERHASCTSCPGVSPGSQSSSPTTRRNRREGTRSGL